MYLDDALLYNQGYMISINDLDSPLFYLFDYDSRSFKINMSFQHFHQFHEIHILLSGRASHIIEGDYYTLQPYDIVLLRPSLLHSTEYPAGGDCRGLSSTSACRMIPQCCTKCCKAVYSLSGPRCPSTALPARHGLRHFRT